MKKILALVLAFCLMAAILPAAAEDAGSLLTMFGTSDGEGDAQGVAGFVTGGDSDLNPDSIGSIIQGSGENVKIYSDEGEDELPGPEKEGGGTAVKTGDENNLTPYYIGMVVAGLLFLYLALDALTDRMYKKGRG